MNLPKTHNMIETRYLASIGVDVVFAKRDIKRGTRIAAEVPLIVVPPVPREQELLVFCEALYKASDDTAAKIAQLPCRTSVRKRTNTDFCLNHQVWEFYKAKKWKDNAGTPLKGKKLRKAITQAMDLCTIFRTDSVQLGPEGRYGSGLFNLYSQMNHSCIPNAHNSYNPTLERLTVHAICDIKAGEQICVDYTGNAFRTRQQRAYSLYSTWGIVCDCAACTEPYTDALRGRMLVLDQAKQALAAYECGASEDPKFATIHGIPRISNAAEALTAGEELVSHLKLQKLRGVDLCRTLRECSKYALGSGLPKKALNYAREEVELEKTLIGTETDHLENDLEGAKFWMEHIRGKSA
ncbi:SET domain-containing protein [Hypoxylon sp. FL1284]|nr:SET domain-containing protein [Hypoxylon sp. FL1284]